MCKPYKDFYREWEREANVTVRSSKCEIGYSHMEFVGHEIKEGEIGI